MAELKESYPLHSLCKVFDTHRSSYRYWKVNANKIRSKDVHTDAKVKAAYVLSGGSAGSRTIATLVTSGGYPLSRYRAVKSMKRQGLVSCQPPKHHYKSANKEKIDIKNHLNREFSPLSPNQVWCGDVTYLWVGDRWRYLATVLDLYGRKIVGFALSDSPDSELTKKALSNAFVARGKPAGVMFHSDQGCHYTSVSFRQQLWRYQIKQSMSRRGNCWDNAPMERFFRSLKTESMPKNGYENEAVTDDCVRNYIYKYYNSVRPHSHNLGLSPNEKEAFYWKTSNWLARKS
jgi:putative transposase